MSSRETVVRSVRDTGLLGSDAAVLVMLSGGADSVCLLHVCVQELDEGRVAALHVNHGLRDAADADERHCRDLCERLGVPLHAISVRPPDKGNMEAGAREARYRAAEEVRRREGLELVAAGHTASDQAETVLYRLVSSPGRRALLGMSPRRDRLVRPLLALSRDETRAYCREVGLEWREDESNLDRSIARNRLRLEVLPELRKIHPAAERNVVTTAAELRDEAEVLGLAVEEALAHAGAGGNPPAVEAARLAGLAPPVRRLVLRHLAEQAAAAPLPLGPDRVRDLERLATAGGSARLDLGGGVSALVEYGRIRFTRPADSVSVPATELPVPGRCRFGEWEVVSEVEESASSPPAPGSVEEALLDRALIVAPLTVRGWSDGDRMRPLGLGGSKTLQDLFTDRKVPRSVRRSLPVVESGGEIAWVAGVAFSEAFKVTAETREAVRLRARVV